MRFIFQFATTHQSPDSLRAFSYPPATPLLVWIQGLASRAPPCEVDDFAPADASLFSLFSIRHASVLEATSFDINVFDVFCCGWQPLSGGDRKKILFVH